MFNICIKGDTTHIQLSGPLKKLVILTTTIRIRNKYNANMIVIIFVGKLYNLISGMLVELFIS